jgi:hypothetical protein
MSVDPRARRTGCSLSLRGDPAAPLRIVIQPTASGRKWTARLGDRVLCVSAWPFVKSARLLLAEGYPADTVVEVWRSNAAEWAMRGRLGPVAATVIDGETASRGAKNGPPAQGATAGLRSSSGRSWGWTTTPSNEAARRNSRGPAAAVPARTKETACGGRSRRCQGRRRYYGRRSSGYRAFWRPTLPQLYTH